MLLSSNANLLIPRVKSIQDRILHSLSLPVTALKLRIFLNTVIHLTLILPLAAYLWTIDEVLFSSYKSTLIKEPIIFISVPRAGTTSLHSMLARDSNTLVSPTTSEFVLPFLSIQYILEYLHRTYPNTLQSIEGILKKLNGVTKEVEQRHPVSLFHPEADDVLIGEWHWSAVGSLRTFPSLNHWYDHYDFSSFCEEERARILEFHSLVCKKVFYHRGGKQGEKSKRLLIRSHLSAFFDDFKTMYPDASFIGIMRDPKQVLESFAGLSDTIIYHATGYKMLPFFHDKSTTSSKAHLHVKQYESSGSELKAKRKVNDNNRTSGRFQQNNPYRKETSSWPNAFCAILSDMMGREARLHSVIRSRSLSPDSSSSLKSGVISFQNFKENPLRAVSELYQSIGIMKMDQEFVSSVSKHVALNHHSEYKKRHNYLNPSLHELGIEENDFNSLDGVSAYIDLMNSLKERKEK